MLIAKMAINNPCSIRVVLDIEEPSLAIFSPFVKSVESLHVQGALFSLWL